MTIGKGRGVTPVRHTIPLGIVIFLVILTLGQFVYKNEYVIRVISENMSKLSLLINGQLVNCSYLIHVESRPTVSQRGVTPYHKSTVSQRGVTPYHKSTVSQRGVTPYHRSTVSQRGVTPYHRGRLHRITRAPYHKSTVSQEHRITRAPYHGALLFKSLFVVIL